MLNDLRNQTDRLMQQQNRANKAIEELQNRPPVQLPPLPATPRRSPYADLLSQIADTLKKIVEAGETSGDLPESEHAESIADTDDTGGTVMNNLQNRLHNVLDMPVPPGKHTLFLPSGYPPFDLNARMLPRHDCQLLRRHYMSNTLQIFLASINSFLVEAG
jgi:hypothetical protein